MRLANNLLVAYFKLFWQVITINVISFSNHSEGSSSRKKSSGGASETVSENFPFTVTPSPVTNCSVSNYTREVAEIQCTSGYDGGIQQRFVLEMISRKTKAIK
jgi:hypothetical protein